MALTFDAGRDTIDEQLIIVTPDESFAWMHEPMAHKDRVHKIGDVDALRRNYLGYGSMDDLLAEGTSNKLAFALVSGSGIRSVIYTTRVTVPQNNGAIRFGDLPGDPDAIRAEAAYALEHPGDTNAVLFYAISNIGNEQEDPGCRGAGRRLIQQIYPLFDNLPIALSTVSPTPGSGRWIAEHVDGIVSDQVMVDLAVARAMEKDLKGESLDAVQKFHLSNGAFIGDCKVIKCSDSDANGFQGRKATINYIYPDVESMHVLSQAYKKAGIIAMSRSVYNRLPSDHRERAFAVQDDVRPEASRKGFRIDIPGLTRLFDERTGRQADRFPDIPGELSPSLSV